MGGKKRHAESGKPANGEQSSRPAKQAKQASEHQQHEQVPVVRLLAIHRASNRVAVAVGCSLRVLNISTHEVLHADEQHAGAALRALCFSPDGSLLLAAGDDHKARLVDTSSWRTVQIMQAPKKVSAATFTSSGGHAIIADKYGDVLVSPVASLNPGEGPDSSSKEPLGSPSSLLLGHLSTIVTSVAVTADDSYVVTTDKDAKVRVSVLPEDPMKGSWEIQSYCFGHTSFVACALPLRGERTLLLTGGGDGTVRVWDPVHGKLLHTYMAAPPKEPSAADGAAVSKDRAPDTTASGLSTGTHEQQQQQQQQQQQKQPQQQQQQPASEEDPIMQLHEQQEAGKAGQAMAEEEQEEQEEQQTGQQGSQGGEEGPLDCAVRQEHDCAAVLSIAAAPDGRTLAVVVEGDDEVQLLQLQPDDSLSCSQRLAMPGVRAPCNVQFDGQGRLWVVGGPPLVQSSSAHVGVAQLAAVAAAGAGTGSTDGSSGSHGGGYVDCTLEVLGAEGRAALEQRQQQEEAAAAAGAGAAARYSTQLRKRGYAGEGAEGKPHRRHVKENERLAQLAAAHAAKQQQQQDNDGEQQRELQVQ